jgi:hypothetical protein
MKKQEREFFYLPFWWLYLFDSLRLREKKKTSQIKKRKSLFDLNFFYLSRGEEKGKEKNQEKRTKKEQYTLTGQIVIYLVRALPERERV